MSDELMTTRLREIASGEAEKMRFELVNLELAGTRRDKVVRIFIDKEGGITLDDCAVFSQAVEAILDAEDPIPSRYVLEVSSPGIERELYTPADFDRFKGKLVKIRSRDEDGNRRVTVGTIAEVDGSMIEISEKGGGVTRFDHSDIEKANLKIDLASEFGGR